MINRYITMRNNTLSYLIQNEKEITLKLSIQMKSFFQFLESTAVQQATRMGLTSDGHGGWYDKKGEFVAKTEKGQLKFFNKRQRVGQDPPSSEREKGLSGMYNQQVLNNNLHKNQLQNYQKHHQK